MESQKKGTTRQERYVVENGVQKLVGVDITTAEAAQDSVEISLDSKGQVKFVVKCYDADVEKAASKSGAIFNSLADQYDVKLPGRPIEV